MNDPVLSLNTHIALLTMIEDMKKELTISKGLLLAVAKGLGRLMVEELEKSRETMKANKMWVNDIPVGERRYRYTMFGGRAEYEIPEADLEFHRKMKMGDIERIIAERNNWRG